MSSPALKTFFKAERYAVVGASKDPAKFGNKVLKWYISRGLQVTPVHPKEESIEQIDTVSDLSKLSDLAHTSVSFITPPAITLPTVKKALQELNVATVWLQPGAENKEFHDWLKEQDSSVKDRVILGGPCILVQGDSLAREQGRL